MTLTPARMALLIEARQAFEKGNLQDAKSKAYRAKVLHGPYSMWEFGDRPDRLLSEIAAAEGKQSSKAPERDPHRAVGLLIVFEDCQPRASDRQPAPVERVEWLTAASAVVLSLAVAVPPASAQWIVYDPTNFSQNVLTAAR